MLNKIAQIDVFNGVGLVSSAEIMKLTQLKQYYKNQGFKEKRIDSIINIMSIIKQKLGIKTYTYLTKGNTLRLRS